MKQFTVIIFLFFCFKIYSCSEKVDLEGCTDCNATNYNAYASNDDSSCVLLNIDRIGEYAVSDSIRDWSQNKWSRQYNIDIVRDSCDSMGIIINNYANLSTSFSVSAKVMGDSIFIPYQIVLGNEVLETKGYFQKDSIFFQFFYLTATFGDPYIGDVEGKKY